MASAHRIHALRGMRDVLSAEYASRKRAQAQLERHLRLHSYAPVELPILENTELYLRKSGEDIAARLYEFNFRNRRIALRPELTASALRAFSEHLRDEPLPLRLQYSGPVFRYEKPQQQRFRQFTVTGAELLGARGSCADAELLHLACSGLERLGIHDYRLVLGTTDVLGGFLGGLGLRMQLLNFLLRNMENLRKRGEEHVIESLRAIYPEYERETADAAGEAGQPLVALLREMNEAEARQAIAELLRSLNIGVDASRGEDEIIDGLLRKIREDRQGPKLRTALDFMARLGGLVGPPATVLPQALELADDFGLDRAPVEALGATLAAMPMYGELRGKLELDMGMTRGLHYYTGLIFEIHASSATGETIQLCGGGRYDNLMSALGGEPTPAAGFAFGIERIASLRQDKTAESSGAPQLIVIPVAEADTRLALSLARQLRERDIIVEASAVGRSLRRSLKQADRRGADLVLILGEKERQAGVAILRDMRNHQEETVALDALPALVERRLKDHA